MRVTGTEIVLANEFFRLHHHAKAEATKTWRTLAFYAAADAKIPKELPQCDVQTRAVYPTSRRGPVPDTTAWFPMTKAIIDGLVDYGCWPDDTPQHVRHETFLPAIKSSRVDEPTIVVGLIRAK